MSFRARKEEIEYRKYLHRHKGQECVFCAFKNQNKNQVITEHRYFWIVQNLFPYSYWDHLTVKEHLMVVPKRHVDAINHFIPDELKEYSTLISQYDTKGYSIYARAKGSAAKSVAHQHTHLLKLGEEHKSFTLYMDRPYIALHR